MILYCLNINAMGTNWIFSNRHTYKQHQHKQRRWCYDISFVWEAEASVIMLSFFICFLFFLFSCCATFGYITYIIDYTLCIWIYIYISMIVVKFSWCEINMFTHRWRRVGFSGFKNMMYVSVERNIFNCWTIDNFGSWLLTYDSAIQHILGCWPKIWCPLCCR